MGSPTQIASDNFSIPFTWRAYAGWLVRSLRRMLSRSAGGRFTILSPSYAALQVLHDRDLGSRKDIPIRDEVDREVINQIFIREDYRLRKLARCDEIVGWYRQILSSGHRPLIVDLGANTGLASLYFSREFPDAKIVAVEPDQVNASIARRNTADCQQVTIVQAGISSSDGMGQIANPDASNWAFRTELSEDGTLPMISVPTLLTRHATERDVPFIAKIDIEGFESTLFEQNLAWVDRFPLIIIELHDWMLPGQANSRRFLQCISSLDRDFVYRAENVFSIKNGVQVSDLTPDSQQRTAAVVP